MVDMKIEEAKELVFEAAARYSVELLRDGLKYGSATLLEAISVLRDGEKPVEVVETVVAGKCINCGVVFDILNSCMCPITIGGPSKTKCTATKTYTTTRRFVPQTVESEPVFEEIEDEH